MEPAQQKNGKKIVAGVVVLFVIALLALGAKALTAKDDVPQAASSQQPASTSDTTGTSNSSTATASTYKDGTYTATGSYDSPGGNQSVSVSVTLKSGVVTGSSVQEGANDPTAREYQQDFISGYKAFVTGKNIDSIRLSRVSGSSLTSSGFNSALQKIKDQAKA